MLSDYNTQAQSQEKLECAGNIDPRSNGKHLQKANVSRVLNMCLINFDVRYRVLRIYHVSICDYAVET